MATLTLVLIIGIAVTVSLTATCPCVQAKVINPGTNYEVDEDDIITYKELGERCDPESEDDSGKKDGLCRATLYCNPQTKRCHCEDIGPYKFKAERGKCKNVIGSACINKRDCVSGAICRCEVCVSTRGGKHTCK